MANEKNLIKNSERTPSELREITTKGGIASGKARRKKAEFKKALEIVLSSKVQNQQLAEMLETMGYDNTNEMAIALMTVQKAMKGDLRAVELIERTDNQVAKDKLDKQEQKERIRALKLENQRKAMMLGEGIDEEVYDDGFVDALKGAVGETWHE
jgi:hypothetical protein